MSNLKYQYRIAAKVEELANLLTVELAQIDDPESKFELISKMRTACNLLEYEIAEEWTYCAHCCTYVRVADNKIHDNGDGTYNVTCGNCGGYHFRNKQSC